MNATPIEQAKMPFQTRIMHTNEPCFLLQVGSAPPKHEMFLVQIATFLIKKGSFNIVKESLPKKEALSHVREGSFHVGKGSSLVKEASFFLQVGSFPLKHEMFLVQI